MDIPTKEEVEPNKDTMDDNNKTIPDEEGAKTTDNVQPRKEDSLVQIKSVSPKIGHEDDHQNDESDVNDTDLSESEIDDYSLHDSFVNQMHDIENISLGIKRKRKYIDESETELKKIKSEIDEEELDKEQDNLMNMLDESVSQLSKEVFNSSKETDSTITDGDVEDHFDISEKLREMGEISVKPINKTSKLIDDITNDDELSVEIMKLKNANCNILLNDKDESDDKRKISNLRKNIREVMDDNQLDASTLAAQRQELERLARVQEQQKIIREVQRQIALERQNNKTQTRVMSLLQGHTSILKGQQNSEQQTPSGSGRVTLPGSSGTVLMKLPPSEMRNRASKFTEHNLKYLKANLTPSVSIAPVKSPAFLRKEMHKYDEDYPSSQPFPTFDDEGGDHTDDHEQVKTKKDIVTIVDSSDDDCIVLSDDEETEDDDDDPQNSGLHVNDAYNVPDENGNVVINIGHPENEQSIFVAPQISRVIKPHQIGGVRFLFDNVIESTDRFDMSTGFGCILAHSMGLGKTLQLVCFCDIFLRHTSSKTVLCIMPINTLQNWLAEFNMWLPEDPEKSPLSANGEVRPRNFKLFVLNDSHKTLNARSKVVLEWAKQGGVLLIGYEMYRLLSLKKMTKKKKKSKKFTENPEDENEQTDEQKLLWDNIHIALVKPGPDLVICDEGHRIKNSHASISVALKQIRSKRRIVLTGYPLQNNLQEYWCMVDFVRPNYLGTKSEFANMFERPIQNGQCIDSTPQDIKLMRYRAHVLHSLLLGFVQRRSHAVLQTSLPQKEEYVLLVRMTTFQRKLYDVFMNEVVRKKAVPNPLKAFAVCCKIWNHPDVLYNFLKKREADLDLEIDDPDVAPGAAPTSGKTSGTVTKGKNKATPKKTSRKQKGGEVTEKNGKPAATISPSTANSNAVTAVETDSASNDVKSNSSQITNIKTENTTNDFIKQESKSEFSNISSTPENSMSSYPPSNYSSGYGSQHSYDNYNPYMTPQNNLYSDPYGNYGGNMNNQNNQNYNYNYGGYNQNDYWQNQNYYNQEYNQNYHQNYDNNYYQSNHHQYNNDQRYSSYQDNRGNPQQMNAPPNDNSQMWGQNNNACQSISQPPNQSNMSNQLDNMNQQMHPQQQLTNNIEDDKPQEIVDLDTKEIKLEVRKDEHLKVKETNIETTPSSKIEDINDLKAEEKIMDDTEKEIAKILTSPTKDDGIPYDWAVELMKGYVPDLIENSPKMEIFFCILDESVKVGDRMLVFSQSLLTLNLIEKFLQKTKIPGTEVGWAKNTNYYRLDGSTAAIEREKLINEFNSNPNIHLFLVSTRAGSLGINLVGANRVIVFDASWNPCHDTQAVCRVYRYGQKKPCFVYRLVMDNCLEKRIYDRQVNKQGMSDRVVDECNPDAHLSLKEVTNLCWDDEEETEIKDFKDSKDKYVDIAMQKMIESYSKSLSKEPFQHESLLVDRKEKKLSSAEKRLAQRGYELEKQAASRPTYMYNSSMGTQYRAIRAQDGSIVHRPVASVRPMQADMSDKLNTTNRPGGARPTRWIPAEVWQRQGMSAQEMTLPLDVVIPTSSAEKANIVLKAGQKVMVLKSPKGIYMQLESGKIIAIRTAFKMGQGNKDKNSKIMQSPPNKIGYSNTNQSSIPQNLKNNSSITVVPTKGGMNKSMGMSASSEGRGLGNQNRNVGMHNLVKSNRNMLNKNVQLGTARPYNMKQPKVPYNSSYNNNKKESDEYSNTNSSDSKMFDNEINDLSKDDEDEDNDADDEIEELKSEEHTKSNPLVINESNKDIEKIDNMNTFLSPSNSLDDISSNIKNEKSNVNPMNQKETQDAMQNPANQIEPILSKLSSPDEKDKGSVTCNKAEDNVNPNPTSCDPVMECVVPLSNANKVALTANDIPITNTHINPTIHPSNQHPNVEPTKPITPPGNGGDDVVMETSEPGDSSNPTENYSIPTSYGMTYGNFPPYYHQSYSYPKSQAHQSSQQYYNYPTHSNTSNSNNSNQQTAGESQNSSSTNTSNNTQSTSNYNAIAHVAQGLSSTTPNFADNNSNMDSNPLRSSQSNYSSSTTTYTTSQSMTNTTLISQPTLPNSNIKPQNQNIGQITPPPPSSDISSFPPFSAAQVVPNISKPNLSNSTQHPMSTTPTRIPLVSNNSENFQSHRNAYPSLQPQVTTALNIINTMPVSHSTTHSNSRNSSSIPPYLKDQHFSYPSHVSTKVSCNQSENKNTQEAQAERSNTIGNISSKSNFNMNVETPITPSNILPNAKSSLSENSDVDPTPLIAHKMATSPSHLSASSRSLSNNFPVNLNSTPENIASFLPSTVTHSSADNSSCSQNSESHVSARSHHSDVSMDAISQNLNSNSFSMGSHLAAHHQPGVSSHSVSEMPMHSSNHSSIRQYSSLDNSQIPTHSNIPESHHPFSNVSGFPPHSSSSTSSGPPYLPTNMQQNSYPSSRRSPLPSPSSANISQMHSRSSNMSPMPHRSMNMSPMPSPVSQMNVSNKSPIPSQYAGNYTIPQHMQSNISASSGNYPGNSSPMQQRPSSDMSPMSPYTAANMSSMPLYSNPPQVASQSSIQSHGNSHSMGHQSISNMSSRSSNASPMDSHIPSRTSSNYSPIPHHSTLSPNPSNVSSNQPIIPAESNMTTNPMQSNVSTIPSYSNTPPTNSSFSPSQFTPFPAHSPAYLASLLPHSQFHSMPPHSGNQLSSMTTHAFPHHLAQPYGFSQNSNSPSTPPTNYSQSSYQSQHLQYPPYQSQTPSSSNQITHSVTSMTNQLPSAISNPPYSSSQDISSAHIVSSENIKQTHSSSVTTSSQIQTKPIVSATIATPLMVNDEIEQSQLREKAVYKPNLVERKSKNQNEMSDPYFQSQHHNPNMYHDIYPPPKASKTSLKNYRHNKMSSRQRTPNNDNIESQHQSLNLSPGSNYSGNQSQLPPAPLSAMSLSPLPSLTPQGMHFQQNMYPIYDHHLSQNRMSQNQSKPFHHTPPPPSLPYQSSLNPPSVVASNPQLQAQPPKVESSLSFLEKTASSINDDKNGFQASLSNITRSYSPSPNPNYNEIITKSSPAPPTNVKPKRQPKTTKKEKKLKAAMIANMEQQQPQKPKTPNISNMSGSYPSTGHPVVGQPSIPPPASSSPFLNTNESLFQNIPTTLGGSLFPGPLYGGYNTVSGAIPPPIINDQISSLPTTHGQHFSPPYGANYLPQYTPPTSLSQHNLGTQSSQLPTTSLSTVSTLSTSNPTPTPTASIYAPNSLNLPVTSSSAISNPSSSFDQSNMASPQVSGSAFHRPDASSFGSPYLPPVPEPITSVPSYIPPSGAYQVSSNNYPSASSIPPPGPYQPPYTSQFSQSLPPPVSNAPNYPPYGYSPSPYVGAQYPPPPTTYPPLGGSGVPSYDPQRYSTVPNTDQYSAYAPSYSFPPYTPQPGQWQ